MQSKTSNQKSSNILLIDSSVNNKESAIFKKTYKNIITFDINSDRLLTRKKILHKISDDFIENSELKLIDSVCLELCQWYDKNGGDELLSYENINLGSLFRVAFHNFLIPIIKNFLILNKLKNFYPNSTFFCSANIFQIADKLGMNSIQIDDKSFNIELVWDKIQFNLTRSISLKISKKTYNKIKNLSKIISDLIIKKNYNKNLQNTFGFIEFDPIKYEKIFQASNNFKEQFLLYNRHRPVFYNMKSLKIIKNSKIFPFIPLKDYLEIDEEMINVSYKKILDNLHQFLNNDEFFNSFFKLNDIELWKYLKPNLIKIFQNKIIDSIYEIEYAKFFLLNHNLKFVIILSEAGFTEQIILSLAKKLSITVILLQHGVILDNPSALNYNKTVAGLLPINSNYFFSWGQLSSEHVKKLNSINAEIKLIGNPNLDRILEKKDQCLQNSNNVLLLATGPRNQQSIGHDVNAWKKYESMIKSIYATVSEHNLNLIIKRHPDTAETDFSTEFYSELSNVKIIKNGDLLNLLFDSKIVLSLGISSGVLESQVLEKPVISISSDHDVLGNSEFISNSCLETTIEEFDKTFSKVITDPDKINHMIRKGNEFVTKNISNIASSRILLDTLKKL